MPLAHTLRPLSFEEFIGQEHLVGENGVITKLIKSSHFPSVIFWGPPGSGKTTLAHLIANALDAQFFTLSGVTSGKEDLQKVVKLSQNALQKTILFIDEIHRWNKAQQDALLPHVEQGTVILIGATTENPSFSVISPLLSRLRVFTLKPLTPPSLKMLAYRALESSELKPFKKHITEEAMNTLVELSSGDARTLLNALEIAVKGYKEKNIGVPIITEIFESKAQRLYDKAGEEHYNTISAFIKSMRGSNADAALYYMHRMLENGEDPLFIARRMIIFASEDIGLADKSALHIALAAYEAVSHIGMPEGNYPLTHACMYLSKAPKSRAVANTLKNTKELVNAYPNEPVPLHLRNAVTGLMEEMGYGKGYVWSKKKVGANAHLSYLPEKIKDKKIVEE